MDLFEYRETILEDIKIEAEINCETIENEFINYVTSQLIDIEEIEGFENCYIEGNGKNNKKLQIDGYFFDSVDKSIIIVISEFSNNSECIVINNSQIDKLYDKMKTYIESVFNGYIEQNFEKASVGYALALEIKDRIQDIAKFRFYIITDQTISNRVKMLKKEDISGKIVELNVWDIGRLYTIYKSNMSKESIEIDFKAYMNKGLPCVKASDCVSDDYEAYLAIVPGNVLANIYIEYGARLLEGNVRSFLSNKGKVNKNIRNTILNNPDMFFAYNNGIATTASSVVCETTEEGIFITSMNDLQIINGGQTTASIANSVIQDKVNVNSVFVPMKISIVNKEKGEKIIPIISRCANSQNKVDEADFFSNHPFHIRIEEYSRKTYAPAINGNQYQTIWFYERARGQYIQEQMKLTKSQRNNFQLKNPKNQLIKKVDLAKYINTYECLPHIISKGSQISMREFAKRTECLWEKSDSFCNDYYYKKAISLAIIFKETEKIISNEDWYKAIKSYKANIVTYTLSSIFNYINKNFADKTINFKYIWNNQTINEEFKEQIKVTSKLVYEFITDESRPILNVTEWCKKEACWDRAKELNFGITNCFINTLADNDVEQQIVNDAKKDRKIINQLNEEIEVINLGEDYWKNILEWAMDRKLLTIMEQDLITMASNFSTTGKIPSTKQANLIFKTREKLYGEGLPQND